MKRLHSSTASNKEKKRRRRGFTHSHLPTDLIFSILLNLPAKSLLRFRCVCKEWSTIIHSPAFISIHNFASMHLHEYNYLIHDYDTNMFYRSSKVSPDIISSHAADLSEIFHDALFYFHGSCNGLVCMSITHDWDEPKIFLWNPSINRVKVLEHECNDGTAIGFGRCEGVMDDCKVVKLCYDRDDDDVPVTGKAAVEVVIYTLSANSWKRFDTEVDIFRDYVWPSGGVSVNGALHWVGKKLNQERAILSFDLQSEVFGEITLPRLDSGQTYDHEGGQDFKYHLGNYRGALSFVTLSPSGKIIAWIMKEYGVVESWTQHVVDFGSAENYRVTHLGHEGCIVCHDGASGAVLVVDIGSDSLSLEDVSVGPEHTGELAIDYNESLLLLNDTASRYIPDPA